MKKIAAAEPKRLSFRRKLGWGVGGAAEAWMANGLTQLTGPIYTIALKLDPARLGFIGSAPRFLDAIYDIWLGFLSDNARTRWGRRRPFIAAGAVACAIFFILIGWVPLGISANQQLGYFAVVSTGYWLAFGTFAIPFNALGFELTSDYEERTTVQAYRFFSIQVAGLALQGMYSLCFLPMFTRHVPAGVPREVIGARWVTVLFGVAVLITGMFPAIVSRENPINEAHAKVPLIAALKLTFSDRLFLHFIAMIILSITGVTIATSLQLYMVVYHVFRGDREAAARLIFVSSIAVSVLTVAAAMLIPKLSKITGKIGMILIGEALLMLGAATSWFCYTPAHPYLLIVPAAVSNIGLAAFQVLYGSFLGDICDEDELRSDARREGMYGAAATFLNKLVYASQGALSGLVLIWTGYSAALPAQSESTLTHMRLVFAVVPGFFAIGGTLLAIRFPITAARALRTKQQLDQRHLEILNRREWFPVISAN